MKKWLALIHLFLIGVCFSQLQIDEVLKKYNDNSVKYVYSQELFKQKDIIYIDAREQKEFDVSHLENSIFVGFEKFSVQNFESLKIKKDTKIVVYCSIGVRSEKIAKKIISLGYTNISNLFGGIFLWKNNGGLVYDPSGKMTENVHAYSETWGQYLTSGIKVYN